uniref:Uncharacterized protein n=1 Tax=Romanomermis culicivorax TaxID=13658 RepID=A0A915HWJ7_ROMCU
MRFDIYNRRWPGSQPILPDLRLSKWPSSVESDTLNDAIGACPKCWRSPFKGTFTAPIMDIAPTPMPVAGPNIPTALVLAMLPPPVPAVGIFVKRGRTRLIDARDPVRIAIKYVCTGP